MKNKILLFLIFGSSLFGGEYFFSCACSGALSSAFNRIERNIVDMNLKLIDNNLNNYDKSIQEGIIAIEKENEQVVISNKAWALKLIEAKKYLFILQHEGLVISK